MQILKQATKNLKQQQQKEFKTEKVHEQNEQPQQIVKLQVSVNYIFKKCVILTELRNQLAYIQQFSSFSHDKANSLVSLQNFALKSQTKIVKKLWTQGGLASFFKKSNQLLLLFENKFCIMGLDPNLNWCLQNTITFSFNHSKVEPNLFGCYSDLNAKLNCNEDILLITIEQYVLIFIKNYENNWEELNQQFNHWGKILNWSNDLGNTIIFGNFYFGQIAFNAIEQDGKIKKLYEIQPEKDSASQYVERPSFCYLNQDKFALLYNEINIIIFWQMCQKTLKFTKLQDLKLNFSGKQRDIRTQNNMNYIKSKDLLLASNQGALYLIAQKNRYFFIKQIIQLPRYSEILTCCKQGAFQFSNSRKFFQNGSRDVFQIIRLLNN